MLNRSIPTGSNGEQTKTTSSNTSESDHVFFTIYKMLEDTLLQKEPKHSVDKLFTGDSSLKAAQANGKGLES